MTDAKHSIQSLREIAPEQREALTVLLREKDEKIQSLQHQLDWFKRQLFGQKSEKKDFTDHPYQATIAELFKELPQPPQAEESSKDTITYQRGKAKKKDFAGTPEGSQIRFDESVPVEEIRLPTPELEGAEKDDYDIIGEKTVYRLAQNPASFVILKYVQTTVKKKSTQTLTTNALPNTVFEKSFADVSFLAGLLVDKFLYHLPLYRQHQRLEANGIKVARSTLTNQVKRAIELLRPVYQSQLDHILQSKILAIDETPIKAGKEKKGKLKQAYFWPIMGTDSEICFTFSSSRAMAHLRAQLGDYNGTILSDGYKAYELYAKASDSVSHALCWVHARRYFEQAENSEPEAAAIALSYIAKLYEHEKAIREQKLTDKKALAYRQDYSKPVVDAFFAWLHSQRQRCDLVPSDPFLKAMNYTQGREHGLRLFLTDAELPMDNNHVERSLRCIPMGRRNWLFCWTEIGAEQVGIVQSLFSTCRMHAVNPYDYLVDVLQRVALHPARKVHELTPREWKDKFASQPLRSDLFKRNCGDL